VKGQTKEFVVSVYNWETLNAFTFY